MSRSIVEVVRELISHPNEALALYFRNFLVDQVLDILCNPSTSKKNIEEFDYHLYRTLVAYTFNKDFLKSNLKEEEIEEEEAVFLLCQHYFMLFLFELVLYSDNRRDKNMFQLPHVHGTFEEWIEAINLLIMPDSDTPSKKSQSSKKKTKSSKKKKEKENEQPKLASPEEFTSNELEPCESTRDGFISEIKRALRRVKASTFLHRDNLREFYNQDREKDPAFYTELEEESKRIVRGYSNSTDKRRRHPSSNKEGEEKATLSPIEEEIVLDDFDFHRTALPGTGLISKRIKVDDIVIIQPEGDRLKSLEELIIKTFNLMDSKGPYENILDYLPEEIAFSDDQSSDEELPPPPEKVLQQYSPSSPIIRYEKETDKVVMMTPPPGLPPPGLERKSPDEGCQSASDLASSYEESFRLSSDSNSEFDPNSPDKSRKIEAQEGSSLVEEQEIKKTLSKGQKKKLKQKLKKATISLETPADSAIDSPFPRPNFSYEIISAIENETEEKKIARQMENHFTSAELLAHLKSEVAELNSIEDINLTKFKSLVEAIEKFRENTTPQMTSSLHGAIDNVISPEIIVIEPDEPKETEIEKKKRKRKIKKTENSEEIAAPAEEKQDTEAQEAVDSCHEKTTKQRSDVIRNEKVLEIVEKSITSLTGRTPTIQEIDGFKAELEYYKDLMERRLAVRESFEYLKEDDKLYENGKEFPSSAKKEHLEVMYDGTGIVWKLIKRNISQERIPDIHTQSKAADLFKDILYSLKWRTIINFDRVNIDVVPLFPLLDEKEAPLQLRLLNFRGGNAKFRKYRKWIKEKFEKMAKSSSDFQIPAKFVTYYSIKDGNLETVADKLKAFDRMFYSLFCIVSVNEAEYIAAFEIVSKVMDSLRLYVSEKEDQPFHDLFRSVVNIKNRLKESQFLSCMEHWIQGDIDAQEIITKKDWNELGYPSKDINWIYEFNQMIREDPEKKEKVKGIVKDGALAKNGENNLSWLDLMEAIGFGQKNAELLLFNPKRTCTKEITKRVKELIEMNMYNVYNLWSEEVRRKYKLPKALTIEVFSLTNLPKNQSEHSKMQSLITDFNRFIEKMSYIEKSDPALSITMLFSRKCQDLLPYPSALPEERIGLIVMEKPVKFSGDYMMNYQVVQAIDLLCRLAKVGNDHLVPLSGILLTQIDPIQLWDTRQFMDKFKGEFFAEYKDLVIELTRWIRIFTANSGLYLESIRILTHRYNTYNILSPWTVDMRSFIFEESQVPPKVTNVTKLCKLENMRYIPVGLDLAILKYSVIKQKQNLENLFVVYVVGMNSVKREGQKNLTPDLLKEIVNYCSPYAAFLVIMRTYAQKNDILPEHYDRFERRVISQARQFIQACEENNVLSAASSMPRLRAGMPPLI